MRKRILVCDVDGVVVDMSYKWYEYIKAIVPDVNVTYQLLAPYYDFHIPVRGYISKEEAYHFWKQRSLYDNAAPLAGAVEIITKLKNEYNFDIVFASHVEGDHAKSKYEFLTRNFPVDGFIATREKGYVRADVAIDDRVEHLISHPINVVKVLKETPHAQTERESVKTFSPCLVLQQWNDDFLSSLIKKVSQ